MTRAINAAGLDLIKRNEGLRLAAYQDVAGIWTIGYGHTPASPGQNVTPAQAETLLVNDLNFACAIVSDATINVHTTDNQFAAMVSLAFNIGIQAFRTSSVAHLHQAGNFSAAADAFLLWDKAHVDGQLVVVQGLLRRRGEERTLYLSPTDPLPVTIVSPIDQILAATAFKVGVAEFQRANGLLPDGVIGPLTLRKIRESMP